MAKLFAVVQTEKNGIHKIANRNMRIDIFYGSKENSKKALVIYATAEESFKFFVNGEEVEPIQSL